MSCSTAKRWFSSNHEYFTLTEDYALVRRSAALVEAQLASVDYCVETRADALAFETYDDFDFNRPQYFSTGLHLSAGLLIYADVNAKDPNHKKQLYEVEAKIPRLEERPSKLTAATKALVQALRKTRNPRFHVVDDDHIVGRIQSDIQEGEGFVRDDVIRSIIELQDKSLAMDVLTVLSCQGCCKNPRPVMLLIDMVHDPTSTAERPRKGLAIAYSFAEDKIIIKSFDCTRAEHPLGQSWSVKESEDGFYISESVANFLDNLTTASTEDQNPLHLIAERIAGVWIKVNHEAWKLSEEKMSKLDASLKSMHKTLRETPFPKLERATPPAHEETTNELRGFLEDFRLSEVELRTIAIHAKQASLAARANSIAKFYEAFEKALVELVDNPEEELDITKLRILDT